MGSEDTVTSSPFLSPTELIKQKDVALMFDCINLNSTSLNDDNKYAFCTKTKDLYIMLEKYTAKKYREEVRNWYKQLDNEIAEINKKNITPADKGKLILDKKYQYALEVHEHNQRVLMNSPIVEIEAEGELDITDDDAISVIRGGKRVDDGRLIS